MKKQLLAAAALALVSGVAAADATVYGFIDAGVYSTNNGGAGAGNGGLVAHPNPTGAAKSQTVATDGQWFPSMLGFTGSEDLGGGLKTNFNLQSSLSNQSGANGLPGLFFDRYATVGLSGNFGKFDLGTQIDALFLQSFMNGVIPTHADSLAVHALVAYGSSTQNNTTGAVGSRVNNAITYQTPTVNGLKANLQYALGGVAGSTNASSSQAIVVNYDNSGVNLNAGYETVTDATGKTQGTKGLLGAKTSVGAFDLAAQVNTYKSQGVNPATYNVTGYEAGVAYHVSPVLLVGVNYEQLNDNVANITPQVWSVKAKYDFSKRTYAYTMINTFNKDAAGKLNQAYGQASGSNSSNATGVGIGLVHAF